MKEQIFNGIGLMYMLSVIVMLSVVVAMAFITLWMWHRSMLGWPKRSVVDRRQTFRSIGGFILVAFALLVAFTSCATSTKIEYRDRDVHHYNTIVQHDTLREHTTDSIYEKIYIKGDTVYKTKYVEKTRWRNRIVEKRDTCWRDSIQTEHNETIREVVKYPKTYWWLLGISIISIIFAFKKLTRWLKIH